VTLAVRVTLDGLGHRFAGQPFLFRGLSTVLRPDRVYALVGPSGSGKSTLLSLLAGWVVPTEGEVRRHDVVRTGWVFQNPHGVARRTALDHVVLPLLVQGLGRRQAEAQATDLLAEFGLAEAAGREFSALSGGEAQRLMLARGIAARPDLFLVDEPTAQLDARTAAEVSRTLTGLARRGTVVVVATHDPHTRAACTDVIDLADLACGGCSARRCATCCPAPPTRCGTRWRSPWCSAPRCWPTSPPWTPCSPGQPPTGTPAPRCSRSRRRARSTGRPATRWPT
jgi:ABC-type lipoprotein export system ATPase subunit